MIDQSEIVIFIGPSITVTEAKKILPNAKYLPPARCGDMIQALRLRPKIIVVIDGFFQNTAAVWHKEILYVMEKGVLVYGCSSMGALRAAELSEFGMIGIGEIFAAYHSGEINDDDEVAVFHRPAESDYLPTSDAMVNIRATVARALDQEIINYHTAQELIIVAKKLFYSERTLQRAIELTEQNKQYSADLVQLKKWLAAGNYVNLKRYDAIELLAGLKDNTLIQRPNPNSQLKVNRSLYLRRLQSQVMNRPFSIERDWLTLPEKVLMKGRLLGESYLITRSIGQLLAIVDAIAAKEGLPLLGKNVNEFTHTELCIKINEQWFQENDADMLAAQQLFLRLARIDTLLSQYETQMAEKTKNIHEYLAMDLLLAGRRQEFYKQQNSDNFQLRLIKALLWRFIYYYVQQRELQPQLDKIQQFSNEFRKENDLFTQQDTENWLAANNYDLLKFHQLMQMGSCYQYFVNGHNLDPLEIHCREDILWLLDSFYLTGLYSRAKQILLDAKIEQEIIKKILLIEIKDKEEHIKNLDFIDGTRELFNYLPRQ